jgi:thiol:disulfide interchange protein
MIKKTCLLFILLLIGTAVGYSQDKIVTLSTRENNIQTNQFTLTLQADIDKQYHIYGIKEPEGPISTAITFKLPKGLMLKGGLTAPTGKKHFDEGFGVEVTWHSGIVSFQQPMKILGTLNEGDIISIEFLYQACTETYCLPPKTITIDHPISKKLIELSRSVKTSEKNEDKNIQTKIDTIIPSETGGIDTLKKKTITTDSVEKSVNERTRSYEALRNESLLSFIGLAFLTGFLALLTPCVFPMIPITVSFFTKHSAASRKQAIKKSIVYALGIIFSFTLFGWLMSLILGATGAQNFAANIWVNLFIGVLFIVFAISLFGVFEIRLPSFLVNLSQLKSGSQGYAGTLFAGVTFTLVSFTCTVQFLGILMVASAQGEWFLPVIGMLCFASAFAAPFFLLSLFPQYIANMPKSGGWLHATKITMALVEIAAAFKFFSNIDLVMDLQFLTRPALLSIWIVLFGMTGFYLLGKIRFSEDDDVPKIGFARTSLAILFLSLTTYLCYGLFDNPLQSDIDSYLPPRDYGTFLRIDNKQNSPAEEMWIENYEAALIKSRETGLPMFIDFTGKTCTNCRLMEKTMFVRKDVQSVFNDMILVRLWTDFGDQKEYNQELQQRLVGSVALPFYAVVDAEENVYATFGGLERDPEIFKRFLHDGLNKSLKLKT